MTQRIAYSHSYQIFKLCWLFSFRHQLTCPKSWVWYNCKRLNMSPFFPRRQPYHILSHLSEISSSWYQYLPGVSASLFFFFLPILTPGVSSPIPKTLYILLLLPEFFITFLWIPVSTELSYILVAPPQDSQSWVHATAVSYTHLTLPTTIGWCRSRWSPYH